MLEDVRIRGLGVIDDAVLALGPGLTVVSGETGAGKTMVVTGMLLLFGGRGDAARVRSGVQQALVDGRLELDGDSAVADRVRAAGGELDDGIGLTLRRTVTAAGRSRAYVGGAPAPVSVLGELAERLLAVHGQADQMRLNRPAEQRSALDRFAGLDVSDFAAAFHAWRAAADAFHERTARMAELRRETDLLRYGIAEIEAAGPRDGEEEELAVLAGRLASADALRLAARSAHDALLGDPDDPAVEASDVSTLLGTARRQLAQQAGADPELDALARRLVDLAALASDLGADFGAYAEELDADPERLEQVEARRAVLADLARKYGDGADLAAVRLWAKRAVERLSDIDVSDEAIAALAERRDAACAVVVRMSKDISAQRQRAAERLGSAVTAELAGLAMPHAQLRVVVRPRPVGSASSTVRVDGAEVGVGSDGADEVELLLQPHLDAPALPIARGASGGELSRVMLALEVCLAGTDPVPILVFDEVDAGVGGRAALEVGRRLKRLARNHQVLVVTHLAQVAAYADRHVVVDKHGEQTGVTTSDVRVVDGAERVAELARMLGGRSSDTALDHAAELLRAAADETCSRAEAAADETGPCAEAAADRPGTRSGRRTSGRTSTGTSESTSAAPTRRGRITARKGTKATPKT